MADFAGTVGAPCTVRAGQRCVGGQLGRQGTAERILAPLRELRPELDTFGRVPAASLIRLHMDPEGATPARSTAATLRDLPASGIDALLSAAGPDSGTPPRSQVNRSGLTNVLRIGGCPKGNP